LVFLIFFWACLIRLNWTDGLNYQIYIPNLQAMEENIQRKLSLEETVLMEIDEIDP
jgi:hypothetical protein